ncbi:DUF4288 domain-containing protein [Embleya sp. NBC_00888]|uniref:hypothetical protein n=1 Tax=Embleya sp. NBC_00888 TaxID=2975960 RepID=UPI00386A137B|nr:DUF4288 domain-containing protein [Embleya sp. NBC_00888]
MTESTDIPTPAEDPAWHSVRCLFRHQPDIYEERITLWRAADLDEAIALAEADALEYARDVNDAEYLGLAQAFRLFDAQVGHGMEVFSLARDSPLEPSEYLDAFFDTGTERQRRIMADGNPPDAR